MKQITTLLMLLFIAGSVQASLIGQTVRVEFDGSTMDAVNPTVEAGTGDVFNLGVLKIDIEESSWTIETNSEFDGNPNLFVDFEDLFWGNTTGKIVGVLITGDTILTLDFFSDNSVRFIADLPGAGVPQIMNVELVVSHVPVPAAAWLFGSGLIGLVGLARRAQGVKST